MKNPTWKNRSEGGGGGEGAGGASKEIDPAAAGSPVVWSGPPVVLSGLTSCPIIRNGESKG